MEELDINEHACSHPGHRGLRQYRRLIQWRTLPYDQLVPSEVGVRHEPFWCAFLRGLPRGHGPRNLSASSPGGCLCAGEHQSFNLQHANHNIQREPASALNAQFERAMVHQWDCCDRCDEWVVYALSRNIGEWQSCD